MKPRQVGEVIDGMFRTSYRDQLLSEEWRSRRSAYFSANGRFCQSCKRSSAEVTLNLHHIYYDKKREIWDYRDDELIGLCEACHERWHELQRCLMMEIGRVRLFNLAPLIGGLVVLLQKNSTNDLVFAIAQLACEPHTVQSLAKRWIDSPPKKEQS